jgi:CRP/FNR family transcriptional regulator, anaerobic regulatory protein
MSTSSTRRPAVAKHATSAHGSDDGINLRRRQRHTLCQVDSDDVIVVESGCVALDALLPRDRRQIMLVLYPGDVLPCRGTPHGLSIGLTALSPAHLLRVPRRPEQARAVDRLVARSMLYTWALGRLSIEERVATLFAELVDHLGKSVPGGWTFEMPLLRSDIADHLAVNPDTLSRLMSRLKASGILRMPTRRHVLVRDLAGLRALTPLADAIACLASPLVARPAG